MEIKIEDLQFNKPYRIKNTSLIVYKCNKTTTIVRVILNEENAYEKQLKELREIESFADPYKSERTDSLAYDGANEETTEKFRKEMGWNISLSVIKNMIQTAKPKGIYKNSVINGN